MSFFPYHYQYTAGNLSGLSTQGAPNQTIIDPDGIAPTVAPQRAFFSYGNCKVVKSYDTVHRSMNNFTDLGLTK
jgi:hypothetical protein